MDAMRCDTPSDIVQHSGSLIISRRFYHGQDGGIEARVLSSEFEARAALSLAPSLPRSLFLPLYLCLMLTLENKRAPGPKRNRVAWRRMWM